MTDAERIADLEHQVGVLTDTVKALVEFLRQDETYEIWGQAYLATHAPTEGREDTPEGERMVGVLELLHHAARE